MSNSREYELAIDFVLSMLKESDNDVTEELIQSTVELAIKMVSLNGNPENIDIKALIWELQSRCNVRIGSGTTLESKDLKDWLPERRDSIEWNFWKRYERYLLKEKKRSPRVIRRTDELTDKILERLEDPKYNENWDRRGIYWIDLQSY
jgi:hypothetical protein